MTDYVSQICPRCGGPLMVTLDKERLICNYCGTEHTVRQSTEGLSLKPVESLLRQTTSELALRRLEKQRQGLETVILTVEREMKDLSTISPPSYWRLLLSVGALVLAVVVLPSLALLNRTPMSGPSTEFPFGDPRGFFVRLCAGPAMLLIGLVGIGLFATMIAQIRTVNLGDREYRRAQERLDELDRYLVTKDAELHSVVREIGEHREAVGRR